MTITIPSRDTFDSSRRYLLCPLANSIARWRQRLATQMALNDANAGFYLCFSLLRAFPLSRGPDRERLLNELQHAERVVTTCCYNCQASASRIDKGLRKDAPSGVVNTHGPCQSCDLNMERAWCDCARKNKRKKFCIFFNFRSFGDGLRVRLRPENDFANGSACAHVAYDVRSMMSVARSNDARCIDGAMAVGHRQGRLDPFMIW